MANGLPIAFFVARQVRRDPRPLPKIEDERQPAGRVEPAQRANPREQASSKVAWRAAELP
jgi:hypothetical protein